MEGGTVFCTYFLSFGESMLFLMREMKSPPGEENRNTEKGWWLRSPGGRGRWE